MHLGLTISQEEADEFLAVDLHTAESTIYDTVHVHLDQNQFDALVCLIYNIGGEAFRTSTVLRLLNQEDYSGAANAFLMWNKAGGKVNAGLVNRRTAERALFLEPQ